MKKILSTLLLFSLLLGYACSDSDNEEPTPPPFVWNDPADPNYKPEGYNPIQGLWRGVREDGTMSTVGVYYSEEFKYHKAIFKEDGTHTLEGVTGISYIINDTGYKWRGDNPYGYTIEGDILTISYLIGSSQPDAKFKRVN